MCLSHKSSYRRLAYPLHFHKVFIELGALSAAYLLAQQLHEETEKLDQGDETLGRLERILSADGWQK